MEIAIGIVGVALAFLGVMMGYIFRANHRYLEGLQEGQRGLQEGLHQLQEGQRGLQQGQKEIAQMVKDVHEGQKEMVKMLIEIRSSNIK